jgi:ATP-binding cassette subfamily F protein 3
VLRAKNVAKAYGPEQIFTDVNLEVERGQKVALVGQNGMGKSTFLKLFCEGQGYEGEITLGHNVEKNYYAQVQENTLDGNKTVLQPIEDVATEEWSAVSRQRSLLGSFLFREDDMDKKVKVLSGGEKSRLALAKMLLVSRNLIVMDEPTNHLDIDSKARLKDALLQFDGTLLVVSHDRDFLDGLTDKTFEFIDGKVKEHLGPISDFLAKHQTETFREFEAGNKKATEKVVKQDSDAKTDYINKKERDKQARKLRSDISKAEKKIERLESELIEIEDIIASGNLPTDQDIYQKHAAVNTELENTMADWEKLHGNLEALN